ncbi:cytidine deaminase [Aestuariibacter sp. A3R04]|uniref:cytidine deaminase n=1 Tax=Aestuariibacter sp. A3R04 TaxID=2841571 RepID=UPI002090A40B|nr:cytidine deaminase [Aestuariibacter sp. A3R04]
MDIKKISELTQAAQRAQYNAHAPYSGFQVGAAVLTENDSIFCGCNVENAAYPLGQCAEATAIGAMVAGGHKTITAVVIASPTEEYCFPCGGCRQKIAEFAEDNTPVILVNTQGHIQSYTVGDLLPHAFRFLPNSDNIK